MIDKINNSVKINPIFIFLIYSLSLFARSAFLGEETLFYLHRFAIILFFSFTIYWRTYTKKEIYYLSILILGLNVAFLLNGSFFVPDRFFAHINIILFIIGGLTIYKLLRSTKVNTIFGILPLLLYLLLSWKQLYEHIIYLKLNIYELSTFIKMSYRFEGILQNANESVLTYIVGIIFSWLFFSNKKNGTIYLLLLLLFTPIVFAAGSKKGIYLFLGALFLMINKKTLFPLFLLLIIGFFTLTKYNDEIYLLQRFITMKEGQDSSTQLRKEYFNDGINDFENSVYNLIFGFGPTSFEKRYGKYSHNSFIEVTYSYGLFFLLYFIWFYWTIILNFIKKNKMQEIGIILILISLNIGWVIIYDISGICLLVNMFFHSIPENNIKL
jgi:hypothetical protein